MLFRRLAKEFPQHKQAPSARVRIGLALSVAKKYDVAVAHLTPLVAELKDPVLVAETQLLVGRCHSDAGRPEPAAVAYRAALAAKPDWERGDEVLLALATSLQTQKKLPEAAAELNKLNATYAKSPFRDQALYQLAEIAFEEKKFPEAAAQYQQVFAQFPKSELSSTGPIWRGLVVLRQGRFRPGGGRLHCAFEQLAAKRRGPARQVHARAGLPPADEIRSGVERPDGLSVRQAGREGRPRSPICGRALPGGAQTVRAGSGDSGRDHQGQARLRRSRQGVLRNGLRAGRTQEAGRGGRRLPPVGDEASHQSQSRRELVPRRRVSRERKQFDEAAKAYAAGLEQTKDAGLREKLQYKQAWVQYQSGKYAESLATLESAAQGAPPRPARGSRVVSNRRVPVPSGQIRRRPSALRESHCRKAADCDKALYRSGTCANQLKKWPEGQAHFAALIEQFPKYELVHEARYGLGLALQMQEKLDEAKAVYEKVTIDTDTEAAAKSRYMIGEIAFAQKKYSEAIEHFVLTATGYAYEQWQGEANYEMARCFIELKMPEQARDALETVVKKFPKHARAQGGGGVVGDVEESMNATPNPPTSAKTGWLRPRRWLAVLFVALLVAIGVWAFPRRIERIVSADGVKSWDAWRAPPRQTVIWEAPHPVVPGRGGSGALTTRALPMRDRRSTSRAASRMVMPTSVAAGESPARGAFPSRSGSGRPRRMKSGRLFPSTAGWRFSARIDRPAKGATTCTSPNGRAEAGARRGISARASIHRPTTSNRRLPSTDDCSFRRIADRISPRRRRTTEQRTPPFPRRIRRIRGQSGGANSMCIPPIPNMAAKAGRRPSLSLPSIVPVRMNALRFFRRRGRPFISPPTVLALSARVQTATTVSRISICIGLRGTVPGSSRPKTWDRKSIPPPTTPVPACRPKASRCSFRAIGRGSTPFFRAAPWKSFKRPAGIPRA